MISYVYSITFIHSSGNKVFYLIAKDIFEADSIFESFLLSYDLDFDFFLPPCCLYEYVPSLFDTKSYINYA